MREFVFIMKENLNQRAVLKFDIIDDNFEKFTLMYWSGVVETQFNKIIPWNLGSTISKTEIQEWFLKFQPIISGIRYSGSSVKYLGVDEYTLTVNPVISGGGKAIIYLYTQNSDGIVFSKKIELTDGVDKVLNIVKGFNYSFGIEILKKFSVEPDDIICSKNENITLTIADIVVE